MYLSKVVFRAWRARPESQDPHRIHQLLWRAFGGEPRQPRAFLFRADAEPQDEGPPHLVCLVQSMVEADWNAVKELALEFKQKAYDPHFIAGQRLQFLLRAN